MSPAKRAKMDPETAAAILANKADIARAQIRGLVNSLPDSEAEAILAVLDDPPQDEEEFPTGFVWDKLPAEVKNMIYRFVFVSNGPVKPHIMWPNIPHKRHIVKYGLGASFLRCSKAIYAEAYPILRMENTFEIGTHFRVCLGEDKNNKNSDLIRKVLIRNPKLSFNILNDVERLQNIKELTVVCHSEWLTFATREDAERDAAFAFAGLDYRLKSPWRSRGRGAIISRMPKVYYLAEREIAAKDKKANNHISFRFEVKKEYREDEENGRVDGETDLWTINNFDLKVVARNEYRSIGLSVYPRA